MQAEGFCHRTYCANMRDSKISKIAHPARTKGNRHRSQGFSIFCSGINAAYDRTGTCAGNHIDGDPFLLQNFEHADVSQPAGSTAAQR